MNLFALSGLLIGLSCMAMAAWVFSKSASNFANQLWSIFCIAVAIWGFGGLAIGLAQQSDLALVFWRVAYIGVILVPVLFYHFVAVFLGLPRRKTLIIVYGLSIIFLITDATPLFIAGTTLMFDQIYFLYPVGPIYPYFVLYFFIMVVVSHLDLWHFLKTTKDVLRQTQVKWFFAASIIGFAGGATCFLPSFGIRIYPYGNFTVPLYPVIMSYAILKHQLMDIRIVVKKTLFFTAFAILISTLYLAFVSAVYVFVIGNKSDISIVLGWQKPINLFTISNAICFVESFILFLFAYVVGKTRPQKLFSAFNFFVFIWCLGNFMAGWLQNDYQIIWAWRLAYLAGLFIAAIFYDLVLSFFEMPKNMLFKANYIVACTCAAIGLLFPELLVRDIRIAFGIHYNVATAFSAFFVGYYLFLVILSFWSLFRYAIKNDASKKKQAIYFIVGFGFGFLGGTSTLLPSFGIDWIYPVGNIGIVIYGLSLFYAIFKHQILDIRIVIKKTIFYTILTALISIAYLLLVVGFYIFALGKNSSLSLAMNFVAIIFVAITFKPIEMVLHRFLERSFFKGSIGEIFEQKKILETELERRERLRSVGVLAAGMAHEIKNPITAIQTFAEYLPKKYDDPQFRESFSRLITVETKRISEIVRDLLLFARPTEPKPEICDVHKIVKSITDLLGAEFAKHKISLDLSMDKESCCFADPSQVKQAILNIVMNAIDAMKGQAKRQLSIRSNKNENYLEILIEDTGIGIPADKIPHLFDPFYTDKEDGTGLGLAITHSIIEKNHGKIEVESVVGWGTKFKILVPTHA